MIIIHKRKTNSPDTQYRCLGRSIVSTLPSWRVALERSPKCLRSCSYNLNHSTPPRSSTLARP